MFEQFLSTKKVVKHPLYALFLGFFYVILSNYVSNIFFPSAVSVSMLFLCTLLLVPATFVILGIEEKRERKDGPKHFMHDHEDIFAVFLFLFLGIFIAYLFLGYSPEFSNTVSYQLDFLKLRGDISSEILAGNIPETNPGFMDFLGLISGNLSVAVLCFLLSLFYGAGALFLITLNASIFAVFIVTIAQLFNKAFSVIGIFMIHLIPEISGFLAAAIAGGVISRAIMREKFGSQRFRNVLKDGILLLFISLGLITIGAFLELFVTLKLVRLVI